MVGYPTNLLLSTMLPRLFYFEFSRSPPYSCILRIWPHSVTVGHLCLHFFSSSPNKNHTRRSPEFSLTHSFSLFLPLFLSLSLTLSLPFFNVAGEAQDGGHELFVFAIPHGFFTIRSPFDSEIVRIRTFATRMRMYTYVHKTWN